MMEVQEVLAPLIGQVTWQVRRGVGTFLTMEFGAPYLSVREPIEPSVSSSEKVRRGLRRRKVYIVGDWHLWVKYGEWKISTSQGVLESTSPSGSQLDELLRDLDGQRLVSVGDRAAPHSCVLRFDLGAQLEIWPSAEIPDDQWTLHRWAGDVTACRSDGEFVIEKAKAGANR